MHGGSTETRFWYKKEAFGGSHALHETKKKKKKKDKVHIAKIP